jgi:hypothetical protein
MFRPTEAIPARIGELAGRRGRARHGKRPIPRQTRAAESGGVAVRVTARAFRFLTLTQCGECPELKRVNPFSQPSLQASLRRYRG